MKQPDAAPWAVRFGGKGTKHEGLELLWYRKPDGTIDGRASFRVAGQSQPLDVASVAAYPDFFAAALPFVAERWSRMHASYLHATNQLPGVCARCEGPVDVLHQEAGHCPANPS